MASNDHSRRGRALNRRVEVEVWYDELEEQVAVEEVVVPEDIKRSRSAESRPSARCASSKATSAARASRTWSRRCTSARRTLACPKDFVRQVEQALHNLRDKQNVTVKFIGFTDDAPLTGRAERIYGTHLALSKAMARRVSLAIQDALDLPTSAVASDGPGVAMPLASNETPRGRALNRRVEVEFWYDDPLQELPDEPQLCPDAAGESLVTKVYDPPWGRIPALADRRREKPRSRRATPTRCSGPWPMSRTRNVRLRFVGYTSNERLDRRTAIGLWR